MSVLDDWLAELLGVLLGDGCVSRFKSQRNVKTEVAFTGNTSEEGYYRNFLKPLVEEVFYVKGQIRLRPDNTVRLHFRSKKAAEYFLGLGFPLEEGTTLGYPLKFSRREGLCWLHPRILSR